MKSLPNPVETNLSQAGKRRFGAYSTETRLRLQRLENLRRTHGFTKAENALRVLVRVEPFEPTPNIVTFQQAIGCEFSTARTMCTGIRYQDAVATIQKKLGVSNHPKTVVAYSMEQNHRIILTLVFRLQLNVPGAEYNSIARCDSYVLEAGTVPLAHFSGLGDCFRR
jgi:hypothetical protein